MAKVILSINAGSSSVKVSVFKGTSKDTEPSQLAEVSVAGLTAPPSTLTYKRGDHKVKDQKIEGVSTQEDAFKYILEHLLNDDGLPELKNKEDIEFACHRVVHGGEFDKPTRIDRETYHQIEELSDLAPLHNAGALTIVKAVHEQLPTATNIAFFDSAFHSTIPEHIRTYPIDQKRAKTNKLRKYGFHGLSYAFITRSVAESLNKPVDSLNIIALHLGSGASACSIINGKSFDTTMGLTPLAGLPGATRSGSVDPSLIFHFTHTAGKPSRSSTKDLHITEAEEILNKKSGWNAIAGTTDFGVISSKAEQGDKDCQLVFDLFVDKILNFVGGYYVKMGGKLDALVFAGGIGEKGSQLRARVVEQLGCLGFELDQDKNKKPDDKEVVDITKSGSKHRVLICQTDEQTEMARQCVQGADDFRKQA
ncbi:acetate kinase, partial [Aureobasidium melanogenum]